MGASIAEGGLDDDEDYAEAHEITIAKFLDSARIINHARISPLTI
jgi:hypothetical protein